MNAQRGRPARGESGGRRAGRIGGALLVLAVLGLALLILRTATDSMRADAAAPSTVLLDSDPPGALAVSEVDGQILGPTPVQILVPAGVNAAVLLFAERREPQRIVLPEHGQVRISLGSSIGVSNPSCALSLRAPDGAQL